MKNQVDYYRSMLNMRPPSPDHKQGNGHVKSASVRFFCLSGQIWDNRYSLHKIKTWPPCLHQLSPVHNTLTITSLHFLRFIPGRGRRSGSVVSKSFCRLHLLAPPAVPACPDSQNRAISLWVCLLVAFRGSPCPSLV